MIIGLTGHAKAGKNAVASILERDYDFKVVAFADPIREAMEKLDPLVGRDRFGRAVTYNEAVNELGYDEAKGLYPEVRRLLQVFGTEVGRELFGEDVWVEHMDTRISRDTATRIVVTDVRFDNEARSLLPWGLSLGGAAIWVVQRPGVGPLNDHASEQGVASSLVNTTIVNDGTLEDLEDEVRHQAWRILNRELLAA